MSDLLTECRAARPGWEWRPLGRRVAARHGGLLFSVTKEDGESYGFPFEATVRVGVIEVPGDWEATVAAALDALPGALLDAARRLTEAAAAVAGGGE